MSFSLNAINSYAGNGGILLNAQQTGLESAGFVHRLKSFFNMGDARAKNVATLNAIRTAVLSDPRFAPADLQAQAQRLLDDVRTDRAIDAWRIKGLVRALNRLADTTNPAALNRRVDLHMAAVGLPPDCTKYASEVTRLAKLRARQIAAAGNEVDIADIVGKAIDTLKTAFVNADSTLPAVGDEDPEDSLADPEDSLADPEDRLANPEDRLVDPEDRLANRIDPRLADFAGRHLRMFAVGANHTLRSDEEVADLVRLTAQFYAYANEETSSQLNDRRDIVFGSPQHIAYKRDYASATLKFMDTVGRPLTRNDFDPIGACVRSISDFIERKSLELTSHGTSFTKAKVRELVDEVEQQIQGHLITDARDEPLFGSDDKANSALARYVGRLISLSLPDDTYAAIRTHLHVKSVTGLFAQMAYVGIYQSVHGVRPAVSAN